MKTIFDVENIDVKKEEPEFKKGDLVILIFYKTPINIELYNSFHIFHSIYTEDKVKIFNLDNNFHHYYLNKDEIRKPTEKEIEKFFQNEFDKLNKIIKDNNLCVLDSDGFVTSLPKTVKNKC
jgi:hypothetical protein